MNLFSGLTLVLSLMLLLFLGPEYVQTWFKRPRRFRKSGNNRRQAMTRALPF
jgi:hypothetical protein